MAGKKVASVTTTITPGTYVLTVDVANPRPSKRHKYDWRRSLPVFKAGTRFHVTRQRWYHVDAAAKERVARHLADEIEPDGWIYELQLTMDGERSFYDVSSRGGDNPDSLWHLITANLERVEAETLDDVLRIAQQTSYVDGDDILRMMVGTGEITVDRARELLVKAAEWRNAQPDDEEAA